MSADPKPAKRVRDQTVYKQFHAAGHDCWACGNRHVEAAHLLRGTQREDVLEALIPLCRGCHKVFDEGGKYRGDFGHVFTQAFIMHAVARQLRHESGDDQRDYLVRKLGMWRAERYVQELEEAT